MEKNVVDMGDRKLKQPQTQTPVHPNFQEGDIQLAAQAEPVAGEPRLLSLAIENPSMKANFPPSLTKIVTSSRAPM